MVRILLVPAAMELLVKVNWWLHGSATGTAQFQRCQKHGLRR
jgi:hypothetical protein